MMLHLGPIIFGFIIGFILGTRLNTNSENAVKLTIASFIAIFIVILIIAWQLGPYPYYDDLPIATGFVSSAIGLIVAKLIFGK
ncbi:MAG: energy-converting hydrogenase B subunit J [Methanobacteriaceae archaeon]|nr:energy-converting hydrogenase B subunit J [Candidatus Methanorudis spinitermitis]